MIGVDRKTDLKIAAAQAGVLGQAQISQLVNGVRGVGNDLAQEDLLMRIDRIDHQIQKSLGLRLKLFFCHLKCTSLYEKNDIQIWLALFLQEC